jgi:hypothetical protein
MIKVQLVEVAAVVPVEVAVVVVQVDVGVQFQVVEVQVDGGVQIQLGGSGSSSSRIGSNTTTSGKVHIAAFLNTHRPIRILAIIQNLNVVLRLRKKCLLASKRSRLTWLAHQK